MPEKSNTKLSPVAKKVLDVLTPYYIQVLRLPDDETEKTLTEVLNRASKYGSELINDLTEEEKEFFKNQLEPMIIYIISKISSLKDEVKEKTDKNEIEKTDYNVITNFLNGLRRETIKIEDQLEQ